MRKVAMLVLATLFSTSALAAGNNTIFSCTLKNGKPLAVEKIADDYVFSYDKTSFKNKIKQVLSHEDSSFAVGSGFVSSSLAFENGGKTYFIGVSEGRNSSAPPHVEFVIKTGSDDDPIFECNTKKKIVMKFEKNLMRDETVR
ncbi:hypothetical protein B0187_00930 [Haemophilus paracuniculus]|uniref:Uncharacterized protein n=1 Tax=Haemophilus paracuniculus TaxID=734 RepID=A0A1T0AVS0_9PAST|nr:hypothetical protein [Haemophilus paracuniculus]OOS00889.1 hypothetical protein B0187_00930 [Haemophilus paracuniculus]